MAHSLLDKSAYSLPPFRSQGTDAAGYFGRFGGRFMAETLVHALEELTTQWFEVSASEAYCAELSRLLVSYVGRPTPLFLAERLSEKCGAKIYLKREDLCHTGAHKINNTLGQVLLAKHLGKKHIIAETGAGQHGVATAAVCALMGMSCTVYMGAVDIERQNLNVLRMKQMGANIQSVTAGQATLKDAMSEALRDWVASVDDTHYIIGSAAGPHPYPLLVRELQSVIGTEAREQILQAEGRLPDGVVACVGGGSNAIGMFTAFLQDSTVGLHGIEAGGTSFTQGEHCATLQLGNEGILHGFRSIVLQDDNGFILPTHSVSAGLDYPGVGPEHAHLAATNRVQYSSVTDAQALSALRELCVLEGILPALESSHALAALPQLCAQYSESGAQLPLILVNLSGRGDKDMHTIQQYQE